MGWWLSKSAEKFRTQVNNKWPKRDLASDGSLGDASHAAGVSDHNPCWTCSGDRYGVVRAIDLDTNLDKSAPGAMQRLMDDLIVYCRKGLDEGRVSYVIYNGRIASGSYASAYWRWRKYSGEDPHTNHSHISFTPRGDLRAGKFDLDIFGPSAAEIRKERNRITKVLDDLVERYRALAVRIEANRKKLKKL